MYSYGTNYAALSREHQNFVANRFPTPMKILCLLKSGTLPLPSGTG